jgi:sporulation protein YlmC with PRC-barrel domain
MVAGYVGQVMDLTIDSDNNIVISHVLEYNNKKFSMVRVSVVLSIKTGMKAVVEY